MFKDKHDITITQKISLISNFHNCLISIFFKFVPIWI